MSYHILKHAVSVPYCSNIKREEAFSVSKDFCIVSTSQYHFYICAVESCNTFERSCYNDKILRSSFKFSFCIRDFN
ncbi:unnamed protein product [Acanthoscelides obtectus]|uniref:Uncharacterized protein n=1 Tax=Acanthoscelides obtectus TaxID=200917 RepID=A0A9P0KWN0_ACAOB|nr:unnamed protein product [Acanthoscelides obtectus]CAK1656202.1 hypothetical protein AOBTE_LOCUS19613 [Acanthoscelides obtectus]